MIQLFFQNKIKTAWKGISGHMRRKLQRKQQKMHQRRFNVDGYDSNENVSFSFSEKLHCTSVDGALVSFIFSSALFVNIESKTRVKYQEGKFDRKLWKEAGFRQYSTPSFVLSLPLASEINDSLTSSRP